MMKRLIVALLTTCTLSLFAQHTGARYLIITHDDCYDALLQLAEWKTQKGLKTKIARLSEIGSDSTQIKSYVANAYNTWQIRPEYLLLVGDRYQLPFPRMPGTEICYSDNYYTNVIGDFHNEIIPGRFYVSDSFEAKTVVAKVISYDKNPYMTEPSWFRKGVTIVREDIYPPHSDSVYWADARYAHQLMIDAHFVHIDSFSANLGHTSTDVLDAMNDGRSYVMYRGVGGNSWSGPFHNIHPDQMHNGFKLPIVLSGTCATVEGIGREWLSAGTPTEPKGTVGFFGTTTGLFSAAEMRSALVRGTLASIFCDSLSSLGKAAESGRLQYYDEFSDSLEYNSWICLGDPEMTLRTATPRTIRVTHPSLLWTSVCTVLVFVQHNSAPVESALVCLMSARDSTLYQYGYTNNVGQIVLIDTVVVPIDSIFITVTGRNARPYSGLIMVHVAGVPYVLLNSFFLDDSVGGNGDLIVNPGEDIDIPVWLINLGDTTAHGVSAIIQEVAPDTHVTLSDTIKYFGDIPGLDSAYVSDGFNVQVASDCPDLHSVDLQLTITDNQNGLWISPFQFAVHAPILVLENYYFPGYVQYTVAGDTSQLIFELRNSGTYVGENVSGRLICSDSMFALLDSISSFGSIMPNSLGTNQTNPFIITTDPQTPLCYPLALQLVITSGVYVDTVECVAYVGAKDYFLWDPDPNHSSGPVIHAKLSELNYVGDYDTIYPYGFASAYKSLFVCCGEYYINYIVSDTSRSAQEIEFYITNQGGRVYLEGSDVWRTDPLSNNGYDFCSLFGILPVTTTVGYIAWVTGCSGTFTENMLFRYQGAGLTRDYIDSIGGSLLIFKNTTNDQGIGVAYNHRTVGASFEFGALEDTTAPSTKTILIDSIMQYFGIPPTGIGENKQLRVSDVPYLTVYPNPCRTKMCIRYSLGQYTAEDATLRVFDVTGRLLKEFSQLDVDQSPFNQVIWEAIDQRARRLSTGIYFIRIETDNYTDTKKVILLE